MRKSSPLLTVLMSAAALVVGVSCGHKPDDAKISGDIQTKFSQDSGLSSKHLSVRSNDGVVTVAGNVDSDAQRDAAARQAASVAGVKVVVNNLQVRNAVAATASPAPASPARQEFSRAQAQKSKPAPGKKSRRSGEADDAASTSDAPPSQAATTADNSQPQPPSPDAPQAPPSVAVAASAPPPPPVSPASPASAVSPQQPPPPKKLNIDQGTPISVRLIDSIDSETSQVGDPFHATLNAPLSANGVEAIPAGTDITGHIVDVKSAGKFAGQSVVVLQLDSITADGNSYSLQTDQYRKEGSSRGKSTGEKVGAGAVVGAVLGGILGGGKGAGIGAAAGAGAGGGAQAASKNQKIKLPAETVLNFTLQAPLAVTKAPNPNADRPKLGNSQ